MPAAAVIPAPIAYINVVAVKKLVVGFLVWGGRPRTDCAWCFVYRPGHILVSNLCGIELSWRGGPSFTVKKSECSKQAYAVEYISME